MAIKQISLPPRLLRRHRHPHQKHTLIRFEVRKIQLSVCIFAMALVNALLSITDFRSPLARTIVPSIASAVTLQTLAAVPSVTLQTECLYDLAGSLTFISVGALSLFLPSLRAARAVGGAASDAASFKFPSLIAPFKAAITGEFGGSVLNWRQILLTGLVTVWATRRE
jgi:hypothetical protein